MRYNVHVRNLVYLSWFGHNITLKLLLRWCVLLARAYAHLERYRRLQSIWYCCWYSMINYYDLCYRFLVSLKPPTRCNIKVVWWAPPTILVLMCVSTTPDAYYTTVSTSISRQTLQLINKNNICNGIRWFVGWRYGIIFDLDCNNKK